MLWRHCGYQKTETAGSRKGDKSVVRAFVALAIFAWLTISVPTVASADKRVALVVGESAYLKVGQLSNAANDASAIASLLRSVGFTTTEARLDIDLVSFRRALADFEIASRDADVAAFYFSGHGIEVNGRNYLIPVDAELARDVDAEDEAISLERVLRATEAARRLRLVLIDACRSNPFSSRMKSIASTRSLARGLAPPSTEAADTLIAFAAKSGTQALDGDGKGHSPFAEALLRHLATPGLDVQLALRRVRDDVLSSTEGRQEPYTYGSLGGDIVSLVPGSLPPVPSGMPHARTRSLGRPLKIAATPNCSKPF